MLIDNIWIINMKKSTDRLKIIDKEFKKHNIKYNRFEAINGKKLNNNDIYNNTTFLCRNVICNYGIIGCALSHKKLWKQLLNDKTTDYYIIMEDDIILNNDFKLIINKLEPIIKNNNYEYISLYSNNLGFDLKKKLFQINNYNFGIPTFPLIMSGYIISKKGAKILLNYFDKINYHIDFSIANQFNDKLKNLNYILVEPPLIKPISNNTSLTGKPNNSLLIYLFNKFNFDYTIWSLSISVFTIKLIYVINIYLILLILLLVLNCKYFNNTILFIFIIIELILYHLPYFIKIE